MSADPAPAERTYLSPREVAAARGLNIKTVLAAIHDGRLAAENWSPPGKRPLYRVPVAALDELRVASARAVDVPAVAALRPARPSGRFARLAREPSYDRASPTPQQEADR